MFLIVACWIRSSINNTFLKKIQVGLGASAGSFQCPRTSFYLQGYHAHKNPTPHPKGHRRALGIVLLESPGGTRFLMSEVALYLV